jgi:hypothetical protein
MTSRFALAALTAMGLAFAGCGDDSTENTNNTNNTNNSTNNANNTNNASNNSTNNDANVNEGKTWATEYALRFDTMTFDQGTAAFGLNQILATNFNQDLDFPVVVLVHLNEIDTAAGTAKIRGGSGLKTTTAGEYIWDPDGVERYDDGTLVGASGEFQGVLGTLDFVATLVTETDTQKVVIPIQQLEFNANIVLSEDASTASIANGRMAGYLTKEDGLATEISLVPGGQAISIAQLFKDENLNYDSATGEIVEKGTGDSWWLTASFTAVPTVIQGQ